jgi:hypothetical protein
MADQHHELMAETRIQVPLERVVELIGAHPDEILGVPGGHAVDVDLSTPSQSPSRIEITLGPVEREADSARWPLSWSPISGSVVAGPFNGRLIASRWQGDSDLRLEGRCADVGAGYFRFLDEMAGRIERLAHQPSDDVASEYWLG